MTPTDSTTTDLEQDATDGDLPELDSGEEELDEDTRPVDEATVIGTVASPTARRRAVSAVVATAVFELLYLLGITVIAFATSGFAAVGPTLQSVLVSPFVWVPAAVFLVCALVVALPLAGARRAPALTGLLVAAVVYLGATFFVLLAAAGWSAMSVFTQELGVYPFFLAAIVAREVMAWTRFGHPRTPSKRTSAVRRVSAPA